MDTILGVKGSSEIATLVQEKAYKFCQVSSLPTLYNNGNIIFELPPTVGSFVKGIGLKGLDRANDGYSWTRLLTTFARITRNDYSF